MQDIPGQRAFYEKINFTDRIGFGERPAVLIIDMVRGITERPNPMFIDMDDCIPHFHALLEAARRAGAPVIYTTVAFTPPHFADGGTFLAKVPLCRDLVEGSPLIEIDPRIPALPGEIVITKKYPSGFYGTTLQQLLTFLQIDTTIITGNSSSGCVRATAVDACSGGFRVIVPRECIADRVPLSHEVALFDMDAKYGDVVTTADTVAYLDRVAEALAEPIGAGR